MSDKPIRFNRFDRYADTKLSPPTRLDNGWLKVDGRISRIGVQLYSNADGSIRRELRLPEEVFAVESLSSFAMVPVTNNHPPELLNATTTKKYAVGSVGENIRKDDHEWVIASLMLHDAEAITAVNAGRSQLSCGYSCELDAIPGTWNGEQYDAIQRDIRGNHVALVDVARAGEDACMRLDKLDVNDAVMIASFSSPAAQPERQMAKAIRIDGMNIEVTEANADVIEQAHSRAIANKTSEVTALHATVKAAEDKATALQAKVDAFEEEEEEEELEDKKDKVSKCDACDGTGKVDGEKCDLCGGTGELKDSEKKDELFEKKRGDAFQARISRLVSKRVALETEARKFLGAEAKLDGLSADEVKKLVVLKLAPSAKDKMNGADSVYIAGRYDHVLEQAAAAPAPIDTLRQFAASNPVATVVNQDSATSADPATARQKMIERLANAWKNPVKA